MVLVKNWKLFQLFNRDKKAQHSVFESILEEKSLSRL